MYISKILSVCVVSLVLGGCVNPVKAQQEALVGSWKIVNIAGEGIAAPKARLSFSQAGKVEGNDGCNNLLGTYQPYLDHLNLSRLASTKMLCAGDAGIAQEKFQQSVAEVEHFLIKSGVLLLTDEQDKTLITLQNEHAL